MKMRKDKRREKKMKFLEKLSLIVFSFIISVISITLILILLDVVQINIITQTIAVMAKDDTSMKIALGVSIVVLLLAVKGIFSWMDSQDDGRNGVTLENTSGRLVISKESLENLIANVVKEVQGIEAISSRTILDKNHNVIVYVTTLVSKDMMIKEVSTQIQDKIKEALNKTADLEVKQVNVKVKNITNKKIKGLPAAEEETEDIKEEKTE